jgi:hypothetical protein
MATHIGIVATLLALLGAGRWRDRWLGFWLSLGGLGLLLMLGKYNVLFDFATRVPILNSTRIPVRFFLWVELAVAALAAAGTQRLIDREVVRWRWPVGAMGVIIVSCGMMLAHAYSGPLFGGRAAMSRQRPIEQSIHESKQALWNALWSQELGPGCVVAGSVVAIACVAIACAFRSRGRRNFALAALPALMCFELLWSHRDDVPAVDPRYWTEPPKTAVDLERHEPIVRVFGYPYGFTSAPKGYAIRKIDPFPARDTLAFALAPVWGLRSSGGLSPLVPKRMVDYTRALDETSPDIAPGRFDLESVGAILRNPASPILVRVDGAWQPIGSALVFRNPRSLDRVRWLRRIVPLDGPDTTRAALESGRFDLREIAIVEGARPKSSSSPDQAEPNKPRILIDLPEHLEIEIEGDGDGFLILNDAFDPGWSAWVDGTPAQILPANLAFRAIQIDTRGRHRVVFRYEPAGWREGGAATLAGLTLSLAWAVFGRRRRAIATIDGECRAAQAGVIIVIGLVVMVIFCSVLRMESPTRIGVQSRWMASWHRF